MKQAIKDAIQTLWQRLPDAQSAEVWDVTSDRVTVNPYGMLGLLNLQLIYWA
jgi:hypothetical protein